MGGVDGLIRGFGDLWSEKRPPSFAEVLPFAVHDSANGLYELPDGPRSTALGFVLEGLPQVGVSEQMENAFQDLPGLLGENCCLQVCLYADPEVRARLASYARNRSGPARERGSDMHRRLARRRFDHIVDGGGGQGFPCDFRLFFGLTMPGSLLAPDGVREALRLRQSLEAALAGCAIPTWGVSPDRLVQLVGGLLNPRSPSRRWLPYDPADLIANQCLLADTVVEVSPGSLRVSGDGAPHELVSMLVSRYPAAMRLAGMAGLLGDPTRMNLRYSGPFMVSMAMMMIDQESARALVSVRGARATSNAGSAMARLMPTYYRNQKDDWQTCVDVIEGGGGMVLMSHHVLILAQPDGRSEAEERARSVWRSRGFTLSRCEFLQTQGLLACLPMTLTQSLAKDLRTLGWMTHKTTHNAAHGMPVVSDWKGTPNPAMVMVSRRGQLMGLDIFDSPGNYNAVVAGISGSGKSVLLNEIAESSLGMGAKVWIFDIGRSYMRLAELLDGQVVRFGEDDKVCMNPFTAVRDIDVDMRLLKPLFAQMIAPHAGLDDYQRAQLEEAIKRTWARFGEDATATCLQQELDHLGENDMRVADMARMLATYAAGGAHGRWFEGRASVDFGADLTVIELEELNSMPELQSVVMLQLLFQVGQHMYANYRRRKIVIIDEAWDLLRGEHVAEFIEHGYRRARKYNGAYLSATQSVADFYVSTAGRNAIANSDWLLLLSQKGEELRQVVDNGHLAVSAAEAEMIGSLRTVPGRYSEVFVRCEGLSSGVGRLAIDPQTELLFSSSAKDKAAVEAHRARGLDLEQSIQAVLDERRDAAGG